MSTDPGKPTPSPDSESQPEPSKDPSAHPLTVNSRELLQGQREVLIDHQGEVYRLRVTRNGKLILHK